MLTQLSIKNFRGIRDGLFTDFGRINVVVGPNNCGKSTFLEALSLLGSDRDPLNRPPLRVVGLRRNEEERPTPAWWFRLDQSSDIEIQVTSKSADPKFGPISGKEVLIKRDASKPGQLPRGGYDERRTGRMLMLDLDMVRDRAVERAVWLELFRKRQDRSLVAWLNEIYGLSLEALTMGSAGELMFGLPEVGLPIDSLGSGARVAVRLLMGVLVAEGSVLLLEEIDAFQSVASLAALARVLLDACVKGDVQLFLTTHRRQTIGAFLDAGREASVDVRVLPFVTGKDGLVRARGIGCADAAALVDAGEDLRDLHRSLQAE